MININFEENTLLENLLYKNYENKEILFSRLYLYSVNKKTITIKTEKGRNKISLFKDRIQSIGQVRQLDSYNFFEEAQSIVIDEIKKEIENILTVDLEKEIEKNKIKKEIESRLLNSDPTFFIGLINVCSNNYWGEVLATHILLQQGSPEFIKRTSPGWETCLTNLRSLVRKVSRSCILEEVAKHSESEMDFYSKAYYLAKKYPSLLRVQVGRPIPRKFREYCTINPGSFKDGVEYSKILTEFLVEPSVEVDESGNKSVSIKFEQVIASIKANEIRQAYKEIDPKNPPSKAFPRCGYLNGVVSSLTLEILEKECSPEELNGIKKYLGRSYLDVFIQHDDQENSEDTLPYSPYILTLIEKKLLRRQDCSEEEREQIIRIGLEHWVNTGGYHSDENNPVPVFFRDICQEFLVKGTEDFYIKNLLTVLERNRMTTANPWFRKALVQHPSLMIDEKLFSALGTPITRAPEETLKNILESKTLHYFEAEDLPSLFIPFLQKAGKFYAKNDTSPQKIEEAATRCRNVIPPNLLSSLQNETKKNPEWGQVLILYPLEQRASIFKEVSEKATAEISPLTIEEYLTSSVSLDPLIPGYKEFLIKRLSKMDFSRGGMSSLQLGSQFYNLVKENKEEAAAEDIKKQLFRSLKRVHRQPEVLVWIQENKETFPELYEAFKTYPEGRFLLEQEAVLARNYPIIQGESVFEALKHNNITVKGYHTINKGASDFPQLWKAWTSIREVGLLSSFHRNRIKEGISPQRGVPYNHTLKDVYFTLNPSIKSSMADRGTTIVIVLEIPITILGEVLIATGEDLKTSEAAQRSQQMIDAFKKPIQSSKEIADVLNWITKKGRNYELLVPEKIPTEYFLEATLYNGPPLTIKNGKQTPLEEVDKEYHLPSQKLMWETSAEEVSIEERETKKKKEQDIREFFSTNPKKAEKEQRAGVVQLAVEQEKEFKELSTALNSNTLTLEQAFDLHQLVETIKAQRSL